MNIRITQIDGSMPNLALMALSSWHRARGDTVFETRTLQRDLFEPKYDVVYASTIFNASSDRTKFFIRQFPNAIVGGSGSGSDVTVEDVIGQGWTHLDYTGYPDFKASIGFTQRGCRLKCAFCIVPKKEGSPTSVKTIDEIWRGPPHPRSILLLDNDFFGQKEWEKRIIEIIDGNFKVCFNQGINARIITDKQAEALASVQYRSKDFSERRIYIAWDRAEDERTFFRGVDRLEKAGIPAKHMMSFMLVGFDPADTWDAMMLRFQKMVDRGILPYPMIFSPSRKDLMAFKRWVVTGLYRVRTWEEYKAQTRIK